MAGNSERAARKSASAKPRKPRLDPTALLDLLGPVRLTDGSGAELWTNAAYRDLTPALGAALGDLDAYFASSARDLRRDAGTITVDCKLAVLPGGPPEIWRMRHGPWTEPGSGRTVLLTRFENLGRTVLLSRALAAERERLDDISRLMSDWLWETDRQLRLSHVSPRFAQAIGRPPAYLQGRRLEEFGRFDFASQPTGQGLDLEAHEPFRSVGYQIGAPATRMLELSAVPKFSDATGEFAGYRGVATDVTERNSALAAATDSQLQLIQAIESVSDGFALFDGQDRLLLCNDRFRELVSGSGCAPGTNFHRIAGALTERVAPHANILADWIARRAQASTGKQPMIELPFSDGRWLRASDQPTPDGGIVTVLTDITELKNREKNMAIARDMALHANRTKTEFLATVSHELRTPLNAIIGFSEVMESQLFGPLGNERYASYVADIHASGQHLLALINDILDVSKSEAGKLDLTPEEFDLATAIGAMLRLVEERARQQKLTVSVVLPDTLPKIFADLQRVKQVALNLLSNAVKFTPAGGRVEVTGGLDSQDNLFFRVSDTGIGIRREDIEKCLSPFGQVDSRLARKYEGTGLGLPLSVRLVELHGGRLAIDSAPGRGTTVTVTFPRERVRPAQTNAAQKTGN
jgi:signal transduction histidine kinase